MKTNLNRAERRCNLLFQLTLARLSEELSQRVPGAGLLFFPYVYDGISSRNCTNHSPGPGSGKLASTPRKVGGGAWVTCVSGAPNVAETVAGTGAQLDRSHRAAG